MKKKFKELVQKSAKEVEKEVKTLRSDITKLLIESRVNPQKDTNLIAKKRKQIAQLLTASQQQKEAESLKNKKVTK